jgi:hypothetical protein
VKTAGLRGRSDPALFDIAARQDRIPITYDRHTMTRHFRDRVDAGKSTPRMFILPQHRSAIGEIVEWLLLVWTASQAEEWRDRIVHLPLR